MATFTGTLATDQINGTVLADTINGLAGDDNLFGDAGIDLINGGSGDDYLNGGDGADSMNGGAGYDWLEGGQGNDTMNGGTALEPGAPADWNEGDTVAYRWEGGGSGITVNLNLGTATDTFGGTDKLIGIERVIGSEFADMLIGSNAGQERFTGFEGNDNINGGGGFDILDYHRETNNGDFSGFMGIVVNLAAGTVRDTFGNTDTVSNIEGILATNFADELRGNSNNNKFFPQLGTDYINGGSGSDTVSYLPDVYRFGLVGIDADLARGSIIDTQESIDTIVSIENVQGTYFNDSIRGNNAANTLDGVMGDDVLKGRGGNDTLYGGYYTGNSKLFGGAGNDSLDGGKGNDFLRGGDGNDTFIFRQDSDEDSIRDFKSGFDKINVHAFGFASTADVLALVQVLSDDTALLVLPDDTYVEFANIDTTAPYLVAGDIII